MGKIIGPFDAQEWITMLELKEDVKFMLRRDPVNFQKAIAYERSLLKNYFTKEAA